ncbi:MAG: hypothetical protein Q8O56_10360 [Solirubrobacteraceae bacterium]|nr:hypothetical protein [Solirubrobacteraceae bacterium]
MPSTVKLSNGDKIHVDDEPQALADRVDAARAAGALIKLDGEDGAVWINPQALATIAPHRSYRRAGSQPV